MLTSDETPLGRGNAHAHVAARTGTGCQLRPLYESNAHARVSSASPLVGGAGREPYSPHRRSAGQHLPRKFRELKRLNLLRIS